MYNLFMILAVLVSVVLIITVLLQSSKGGGLAGSFGGTGAFGTVFGTRRTADFLSKTTWWLGGILIALSLIVNLFFLKSSTSAESVIQDSRSSVPATSTLPQAQPPQQQPAQQNNSK